MSAQPWWLQHHWLAGSGAGEGTLALGGQLDEMTLKITADDHFQAVDPGPQERRW